jgi:hypothetical protein
VRNIRQTVKKVSAHAGLKTSQLTTEFVTTRTKRIPVGIHLLFKTGVLRKLRVRMLAPHTRMTPALRLFVAAAYAAAAIYGGAKFLR